MRLRSLRGFGFLLAAVCIAGCKKSPPAAADAGIEPSDPAMVLTPSGEARVVEPVYKPGPIDPRASKLCQALYRIGPARRAECCAGTPPAFLPELEEQCTMALSDTLRAGAARLEETRVAACEAALGKQHEGCDWVGPVSRPIPIECTSMLDGLLAVGSPCRSSLECVPGSSCVDASPTQRGRCLPPLPRGAACNQAQDPLAAALRDDRVEIERPVCSGFCTQRRCLPFVATKGACKADVECGPSASCVQGVCESGRAGVGQKCLADKDCKESTRCRAGRCDASKSTGDSCKNDLECIGGCIPGSGGASVCGKKCTQLGLVRTPIHPSPAKRPAPTAPATPAAPAHPTP